MTELSNEVLMLVRGAIDSKIEVWKNLNAAEKALGGGELSEDVLEDLVVGIGHSSQLTNKQLENWIMSVFNKDEGGRIMSLAIKPNSLGYLRGLFEETEIERLCVTEYRDSSTSTVTISGPGVENKKKEIETAFFVWYAPQGYGSSIKEARSPTRGLVLTLHRYLSCD